MIRNYWLFTFLLVLTYIANPLAAGSADQVPPTVNFRDVFGNTVNVAVPARRIVVINGDAVEILCAIGAKDNIVGISSHTAENPGPLDGLEGKAVVGSSMNPSIERIIECRPDLVIAYEMWMTAEAFEDKLKPLGIPVARMYCYRIARMDEEIRTLGRLVGRENRADAYIADMHRIIGVVRQRTDRIHPRVRIYNESYGPYQTVSDGCGGDKLLELAGVANIAAGQPVPWPEITAEWVVEQNPDLIVKVANAFLFGMASMVLVYGIARIRGAGPGMLILAGIAVNYFFSALIAVVKYMVEHDALAGIVFWLIGGLNLANWKNIGILLPLVVVPALWLILKSPWDLNAMSSGDEVAIGLGVNPERTRIIVLILAALITSSVVAFTGVIGFVCLVGPHMARMMIGSDHRFLLPFSCLTGALMLLLSDAVARTVIQPTELPVGIVTALLGVPFFLHLLIRSRRYWS